MGTGVRRRDELSRADFTSDLSQAGVSISIDQPLPDSVSRVLESHGIDHGVLERIAGSDRVIRGEQLGALYDEIRARNPEAQRRRGDIDATLAVYRTLQVNRGAPANAPPVDAVTGAGAAPRRPVGLRWEMGRERRDNDPAPQAVAANVAPSLPNAYEGRPRRVNGHDVATHTVLSPADQLRAQQMAGLPPARQGNHQPVRAYIDAIAARDRIAELEANGQRRQAARMGQPEGVSNDLWVLTNALRLEGISAQDVESYLATGQLPDLLDANNQVVMTGAQRMQQLEREATQGGSWTATNSFTYLIGARRSAMAAERQAMQARLDQLPQNDPMRGEIQSAIEASTGLDRDLGRGLQGIYRARTYAAEHQGQGMIDRASNLDRDAQAARDRGDNTAADRLQAQAQQTRDRGAVIAQAEGRYRAGMHQFDAASAYRLAARAQVETGTNQVDAMRRSNAALPAEVPAVLGDGDERTTTNGVAGAGNLLNAAAAQGDHGQNQQQLGLQTARQGAIAQFHQLHVERSGYNDRVSANGTPPADRTDNSRGHRQAYLDARAEQSRLMMERIGLYGPVANLNSADATEVGRLQAQRAGIAQEFNAALGTSLASDRTVDSQTQAVRDLDANARQARTNEADAQRRANEQQTASGDQRSNAGAMTRVFQTKGQERRDYQAIDDANASEQVVGNQVPIATAARQQAEGRLADGRDLLRGARVQQARDREDAERVRASMVRVGDLGRTTSVADAYDRTRTQGDNSARASATALDRAQGTLPPNATPGSIADIASARLDLARYWTGTTEMQAQAMGDAGRTGATERLDTARTQIDAADRARQGLDAGTPERLDLASGVVRERSALATANSDYRPGVSRDELRSAEAVANGDLANDARRLGDARAQIGSAAVTSLVRHNARFEQVLRQGHHDDTADDELYRQGHRMLDRQDIPNNDAVRNSRAILGRVDEGLNQVPEMFRRSGNQIRNGFVLAAAQTGTMGYAEGVAGSATMSSLITGAVWLVSIGNVDMKDDVQGMAEGTTNRLINQENQHTRDQMQGASDLGRAYQQARANGRAFQFLNSMRIIQITNMAAGPSGIPRETGMAARDFVRSQIPADRAGSREWAAFAAAAYPTHGGGVPLAQAMNGSVLGYRDAVQTLGDERIAIITFNQQTMLGIAGDSLKRTTDGMWAPIAINTVGEVVLGIVLTGGLGSAAAVGEAGEAANTVRTGLQAANTARTVGTLARVAESIATFRSAYPVLHTAAVAVTVGGAMSAATYASGRVFGRNSAATNFVQVAGNFIPLGASSRAAGLGSAGRRAVTIGEEGAIQLSRGTSWAAVREGLGMRNLIAHARFYGPQFAMAGASVGASMVVVPAATRALGLERSELAQAAIGVMVNAFVASGFSAGMSAQARRAQSAGAAEHLVNGIVALREGTAEVPQSARAELQRSAMAEIDAFQSRTQGRMPTAEEVAGLQSRLVERLGIDATTPPGQQQLQVVGGAVEGMRIARAGELGLTQAIREQRTGPNATNRERVGAMVTPDEISPSRPPSRELVQRAVDVAAENLYQARGGAEGGASRAQAYRDAAQQIASTFHAQALQEVESHGRTPYAESLVQAESLAGDRAQAAEISARLQLPGQGGAPAVIGSREGARLEPFLANELGRARQALDANDQRGDLRAHWADVRQRLVHDVGLNDAAADATVRTMQGEVFEQGVARRVIAEQARTTRPLSNADLMAVGRETARRLGFSPEAGEILARDLVSARPRLEQAGMIRPGGETTSEAAVRQFKTEHPEIAERFQNLSNEAFLRAFGENPNAARLGELSQVRGFAELAEREPARARRLLEAPANLDVAGIAQRHGIAGAELYAESPAALAALVRADGEAGASRALAADPAAARARGMQLAAEYAGRVDTEGRAHFEVLSGADSSALLGRAQFPNRPADATVPALDSAQLAQMGLEPRYRVTIDGVRMGLSEAFDLGNGRRGMVAYIESPEGQVHAQILYRSNSQSAWRTSDASYNGHYGKGVAEVDTQLPIDLTVAAHRMAGESVIELRDPATRQMPQIPDGEANPMASRVFRGLTLEVTGQGMQNGQVVMHGAHYHSAEYAQGRNAVSVGAHGAELPTGNPNLRVPVPGEMRLPPPGQVPDFTQPPEATFRFRSQAYADITGNGELTGRVYRSRDGSLRYLLVEDSAGRVGVVGAEQVGSPVTRWGNRRDYVDLHGMDAPLFEYGVQQPRGYSNDTSSNYRLNWNYARETPMVQEYYNQRGARAPAAVPETAQPVPNDAVRGQLQSLSSYEQRAASALLHPNVDVGVPADVAARARTAMNGFVQRNGPDGARFLVRVAENAGVEGLFGLFANHPPRQIERNLNRVTPEVLAAWRQTPPNDRAQAVQADFARFQNMPPVEVREPATRHYLGRVRENSLVRGENTVIEPRVDVAADVRAINEGRAVRNGNEFAVNGRSYRFHPETGTLIPVRGDGFIPMDRMSYRALGIYNSQGGDTPAARTALDQNRIPPEAREAGLRAYQAGQAQRPRAE